MRDNPINGFFTVLTGQLSDQVSAGALHWPVVILYWLLLVAGLAIVAVNWVRDPSQRTARNVFVAFLRFVLAGEWYTGMLWKLPLPVSLGFQDWMEQTVKYSSWQWHADIMQFFLDHIVIVGPLVWLLETCLAASLMLGFLTRISNAVGALFVFNLMIGLFNAPTEWVWTYVGLIGTYSMFSIDRVGRSLGLDNIVTKRLLPIVAADTPLLRAVRWAS